MRECLISLITVGYACEIPAFLSILLQHLQQHKIFIQSNDNFHSTLPGICMNFHWLWREGRNTGTTISEKGRFRVKYSSTSNYQPKKPEDRNILPLKEMWFQENFTNKLSYRWKRKIKPKTTWKDLEVIFLRRVKNEGFIFRRNTQSPILTAFPLSRKTLLSMDEAFVSKHWRTATAGINLIFLCLPVDFFKLVLCNQKSVYKLFSTWQQHSP